MMKNPFSLEGKIILVTGASSGIGRGVAVACSEMGGRIILNGRNEQRLQETKEMLIGKGHFVIPSDLSCQIGIDNLVQMAPLVDGVVHCAGIPKICPIKYLTRDILSEIININEVAPILLTSGLLKHKKIRNNSSIVFIASTAGVLMAGAIGDADYSATKGGISGFVKTASKELGIKGIRVNTICPAVIETPILNEAQSLLGTKDLNAKMTRYHIRRFGKPEDVAYAAVYLLSDASQWVTGINLPVDGGCHL